MESISSEDPLDAGRAGLSDHLAHEALWLRQPDAAHALPAVSSFDTIRAIAACDTVMAQISIQRQQLPELTPQSLATLADDSVGRIAAASCLKKLARLEGVLTDLKSQKLLAITATRSACWQP